MCYDDFADAGMEGLKGVVEFGQHASLYGAFGYQLAVIGFGNLCDDAGIVVLVAQHAGFSKQ